ncbi:hypothetical protein Avbf_13164, partial [Armadillidium vulgare]
CWTLNILFASVDNNRHRLLLRYGASSEPFNQINTCVPGWPLHHSVVYAHFNTFLALVKGGAAPNLTDLYNLSPVMLRRLSVPHAILKYASEKPEFVRLFYECGGDLSDELQSLSSLFADQDYFK